MAKLLSGQYEALKDRAISILKTEFEISPSKSVLDDIANKTKDNMGEDYQRLEKELQEIESQYEILKERKNICVRKIKDILFNREIVDYWNNYREITCAELYYLWNSKAKKIARENGLVRELSNEALQMICNEVYMANTRNKDMNEIFTDIVNHCREEINSNLSKYLK